MLEPIMGCAWPDIVGSPELLDVPQPLKLRSARAGSFSAMEHLDKHPVAYVSIMAHMVGPNGTICEKTVNVPQRQGWGALTVVVNRVFETPDGGRPFHFLVRPRVVEFEEHPFARVEGHEG